MAARPVACYASARRRWRAARTRECGDTTVATEQREQTAGDVLSPLAPEDQGRRHFRRNVALTLGEAVCFGLGMAFFDSGTVIPGFITALTGSAIPS